MADDDNACSAFLDLINDAAYKSQQPDRLWVRIARAILKVNLYIIIFGLIIIPAGFFLESDFLTPFAVLFGTALVCLGILLYIGRFYYRQYRKGATYYNHLYTIPKNEWPEYIDQVWPELREWGTAYIKYGFIILGSIIGVVVLFWFFLHPLLFLSYAAFLLLLIVAIFFFRRGSRILRALPENDGW